MEGWSTRKETRQEPWKEIELENLEKLLTVESSRIFLVCEVDVEDVKVALKTVTVSDTISKKVVSLSNDKEIFLILREKRDC